MLAKSHTRKHICEELNISYRKCKKIIDDLCAKFETPNALCCLLKALDEGFIKL